MAKETKPKSVKATKPKSSRGNSKASQKSLRDVIEKKAYEIYVQRGGEHGKDLDDWLEAEKIVISEKS
jgi:hypothetical protein